MAKQVNAQVLGGSTKTFSDIETVQCVFNELGLDGNYAASVNGEPADFGQELNDYEFVTFSPAVKGGSI